jgi:hypothetical protein
MTATAARATCASFSHCVRAAESRKSPQNSDFYGHRTTYSEKAHCIKDSVLLDPACGSRVIIMITADSNNGDWLSSPLLENKNMDWCAF